MRTLEYSYMPREEYDDSRDYSNTKGHRCHTIHSKDGIRERNAAQQVKNKNTSHTDEGHSTQGKEIVFYSSVTYLCLLNDNDGA